MTDHGENNTGENRSDHRFYGRRKSRPLKPGQARLIESLLPALRVTPDDESLLRAPARMFAPPAREVWLEIGFGGGEHLAWQAVRNADVGFIGCEPFVNGVAKLLTAIEDEGLANVRIWDGDARDLLPVIGDETIDRVFLLYPDPWPKTRHHKRRFVNAENLEQIHRILKSGGLFRFASDNPHYVAWTLERVRRHGGFDWLAESPSDWRIRPGDWPSTRYEQKALREGRTPIYLEFCKTPTALDHQPA